MFRLDEEQHKFLLARIRIHHSRWSSTAEVFYLHRVMAGRSFYAKSVIEDDGCLDSGYSSSGEHERDVSSVHCFSLSVKQSSSNGVDKVLKKLVGT